MRLALISAAAALALVAAPAFAQNGTQAPPEHSGTQAQSSESMNHANMPKGAQVTLDTQHKIRQSLLQSGFKDVHIVAHSYVIRAKDPNGAPIIMMVSPDQVAGVVEESGSSMPPSSRSHSQSRSPSSTPQNEPAR